MDDLEQFKEHVENLDAKLKTFSDLLDSISTLDDKKKALWLEVYRNAIVDRRAAYTLYLDLLSNVIGSLANHAIHGPNLSKYIERMSRANDQIIKLAELVAAAQEHESAANAPNVFDLISSPQSSSTRKK